LNADKTCYDPPTMHFFYALHAEYTQKAMKY